MTPIRLTESFYHRDCLEVAPDLVGKLLMRRLPDGTILQERIAETEAYRGQEDLACHASKGRTPRTELLYRESGVIYVYLCYGMHWLMNVHHRRTGTATGRSASCRSRPQRPCQADQVSTGGQTVQRGTAFSPVRNCGSQMTAFVRLCVPMCV